MYLFMVPHSITLGASYFRRLRLDKILAKTDTKIYVSPLVQPPFSLEIDKVPKIRVPCLAQKEIWPEWVPPAY